MKVIVIKTFSDSSALRREAGKAGKHLKNGGKAAGRMIKETGKYLGEVGEEAYEATKGAVRKGAQKARDLASKGKKATQEAVDKSKKKIQETSGAFVKAVQEKGKNLASKGGNGLDAKIGRFIQNNPKAVAAGIVTSGALAAGGIGYGAAKGAQAIKRRVKKEDE